jgi:hypothetical protein
MPNIRLDVQTAKLSSKFGTDYGVAGDGKWIMSCKVKLVWPERLELGTGQEIGRPGKAEDIDMHLTFRDTKPELVEWATERTKDVKDEFASADDTICGTFSYHGEWNSKNGLDGSGAGPHVRLPAPTNVDGRRCPPSRPRSNHAGVRYGRGMRSPQLGPPMTEGPLRVESRCLVRPCCFRLG